MSIMQCSSNLRVCLPICAMYSARNHCVICLHCSVLHHVSKLWWKPVKQICSPLGIGLLHLSWNVFMGIISSWLYHCILVRWPLHSRHFSINMGADFACVNSLVTYLLNLMFLNINYISCFQYLSRIIYFSSSASKFHPWFWIELKLNYHRHRTEDQYRRNHTRTFPNF